MTILRIGILGFGTVGSGICQLILLRRQSILEQYGIDLEIASIAVKHPMKHRDISEYLQPADQIVKDPSIDIIIEAIGGLEPYSYLVTALQHGKHVISANKTVVADKYKELSALSDRLGLEFRYSAAVGGATPILEIVQQQLNVQPITRVYGIFNATSNYILSQIYNGCSYEEAFSQARLRGLAEQDPIDDLDGTDVKSKLQILAKSVFQSSSLTIELEPLQKEHFIIAKEKPLKLLGEFLPALNLIKIFPGIIYPSDPLYGIDGACVGVVLDGEFSGSIRISGVGAGKFPTANALLQDIIGILEHLELSSSRSISSSVV